MWICACGNHCKDHEKFCPECGSQKLVPAPQPTPDSSNVNWYYISPRLGSRQGPVTREQLLAEVTAKAIDDTTPVWNSGLTDWTPLGNTELNHNWVAQPWQVDPALTPCVWYYLDQSTRQGPVSGQQIFDLLKASRLKPDSLIWKDGFADWKPLKQTELGSHTAHILPPVPLSAVSDRFAWALATVPMLVSYILVNVEMDNLLYIAIIFVLNCTFLMLDICELKKSGNNPGAWIWLGLVLIPVYLFVRATKVNKHYGYAITNCVLAFFPLCLGILLVMLNII